MEEFREPEKNSSHHSCLDELCNRDNKAWSHKCMSKSSRENRQGSHYIDHLARVEGSNNAPGAVISNHDG